MQWHSSFTGHARTATGEHCMQYSGKANNSLREQGDWVSTSDMHLCHEVILIGDISFYVLKLPSPANFHFNRWESALLALIYGPIGNLKWQS